MGRRGCGCGGGTRGGQGANEIMGYDYISPDGVSYRATNGGALLPTLAEARSEQLVYGGGSIKTIRAGQ